MKKKRDKRRENQRNKQASHRRNAKQRMYENMLIINWGKVNENPVKHHFTFTKLAKL